MKPVETKNNTLQDSKMESGDWVDYYHRVQEFGKRQSWDAKKINKMLGDRNAFEKEFKMVSSQNFGVSA